MSASPEAPALPPVADVAPAGSLNTRPGLALAQIDDTLGPLTDLAGTWVGRGFNLISLPDFDSTPPSTGPAPFRLKLNTTLEILEFNPIGGNVPNRGGLGPQPGVGQDDIDLFGLRYLQRVADAVTNEAMHIEPGFWLKVPPTTFPAIGSTVVRQGVIPHGNSMLAIGTGFDSPTGQPLIAPADSTPVAKSTGLARPSEPYLLPFDNPPLPAGILPGYVKNPNQLLQDTLDAQAAAGQPIVKTTVLDVTTAAAPGRPQQVGGIVNIPFDVVNANATQLDAIFWIETVRQPNGTTFMQLQYTQTVVLDFLGILWPHISVATLVKQ